jgi:hypothetical protein
MAKGKSNTNINANDNTSSSHSHSNNIPSINTNQNQNQMAGTANVDVPVKSAGGILNYLHDHVMFLNSNKFFAGVVMILLNVGSKFIPIQFSKSAEEYLKLSLAKQILIFAMAWMGTRDIYVALVLTAVFTILSDHLFNEESSYCIVPHHKRVLTKMLEQNKDDNITDEEIREAKRVLAKAEKQQKDREKQQALNNFAYVAGESPPARPPNFVLG